MSKIRDELNPRKNRVITKFGNPKITTGGIKKDLRQMIKENAVDTDIYEQIEKYGMNPITEIPISNVIEDFTQISMNLRDSLKLGMEARKKWTQLPREVRNEFDNDIERFTREGAGWMKNQHDMMVKKAQEQEKQAAEAAKVNKGANENVNK